MGMYSPRSNSNIALDFTHQNSFQYMKKIQKKVQGSQQEQGMLLIILWVKSDLD